MFSEKHVSVSALKKTICCSVFQYILTHTHTHINAQSPWCRTLSFPTRVRKKRHYAYLSWINVFGPTTLHMINAHGLVCDCFGVYFMFWFFCWHLHGHVNGVSHYIVLASSSIWLNIRNKLCRSIGEVALSSKFGALPLIYVNDLHVCKKCELPVCTGCCKCVLLWLHRAHSNYSTNTDHTDHSHCEQYQRYVLRPFVYVLKVSNGRFDEVMNMYAWCVITAVDDGTVYVRGGESCQPFSLVANKIHNRSGNKQDEVFYRQLLLTCLTKLSNMWNLVWTHLCVCSYPREISSQTTKTTPTLKNFFYDFRCIWFISNQHKTYFPPEVPGLKCEQTRDRDTMDSDR